MQSTKNEMKKYQIIYADPPWKYGDKVLNNGHGKRFDSLNLKYDSLNEHNISELKVSKISDETCVLFIWTTDSHIQEALNVIKKWGFKYKTVAFYWLKVSKNTGKPQSNLGKWTQKNAEICLFATKGKCQKLLKNRKIHQLIIAPRTEHSRKPYQAIKNIELMFGDLPRIELFARQKTEGWDVWGNEIPNDVELTSAQRYI